MDKDFTCKNRRKNLNLFNVCGNYVCFNIVQFDEYTEKVKTHPNHTTIHRINCGIPETLQNPRFARRMGVWKGNDHFENQKYFMKDFYEQNYTLFKGDIFSSILSDSAKSDWIFKLLHYYEFESDF